jgi:hypothetical protein
MSQFGGTNFNEVALKQLNETRLIGMIRSDESYLDNDHNYMAIGGVGELHQSYSDNSGFSWSPPVKTGIYGQPACLENISGNCLIVVYGVRVPPYKISCRCSHNGGVTWGDEIILAENFVHWDFGYPSIAVDTFNQRAFVAYYTPDKYGIRHVEGISFDYDF